MKLSTLQSHALLADPKTTLTDLDRELCRRKHLHFVKKFFREKEGDEFIVSGHHDLVAATLDRVLRGEINRLIINVPPGYTKTELAVVHFIARGLMLNPRARFIHASFNGPLALFNSNSVKDVLALPGYQTLQPIAIRDDVNAKDLWRTTDGGGMKASSAAGPITGFRAGRITPGFSGALIIDDPLKPDDADSDVERGKVNNRWHSTFKSRLATERVPVIVIMQRLHVDDFSGYLLKGGANCRWHHLHLPVFIDPDAPYPADFTHGDPIAHGLPAGPLWPAKHNLAQIEILRGHPYVFAGQYMQEPVVSGGNLFKAEWLKTYTELPRLEYRAIYADTAQKVGERNDFSVMQCWGKGVDGRAYLIDQVRGKWPAPVLEAMARQFWRVHFDMLPGQVGPLRAMKVEDKSSGTDLIQRLGAPPNAIPVIPIPRDRDKVLRANDVLPLFATDRVRIPDATTELPWLREYVSEILAFPGGAHDDQVDPTMDAVSDMLGPRNGSGLSFAGA